MKTDFSPALAGLPPAAAVSVHLRGGSRHWYHCLAGPSRYIWKLALLSSSVHLLYSASTSYLSIQSAASSPALPEKDGGALNFSRPVAILLPRLLGVCGVN